MYLRKSVWAALLVFVAAVSGATTWQLLHIVHTNDGLLVFLPLLHLGLFFWALSALLAGGIQILFHPKILRLGASMREGFFIALLLVLIIVLALSDLLNWFFVLGFALIFILVDIFLWSGLLVAVPKQPVRKRKAAAKKK